MGLPNSWALSDKDVFPSGSSRFLTHGSWRKPIAGRQTVLITHTHHHDKHSDPKYDPVYTCVLQELHEKFKGSIVGDPTTYKVMKKSSFQTPPTTAATWDHARKQA